MSTSIKNSINILKNQIKKIPSTEAPLKSSLTSPPIFNNNLIYPSKNPVFFNASLENPSSKIFNQKIRNCAERIEIKKELTHLEKQDLIEKIKEEAQKNPTETAKNIDSLGLNANDPEDKKALIAIAKICIKSNGKSTAQYINHFNLNPDDSESKDALIEILMTSAQQSALTTILCIDKFGLNLDEPRVKQAFINVLALSIEQNPLDTGIHIVKNNILNLDLKDPEIKKTFIKIFEASSIQDPFETAAYLAKSGLALKDPDVKQVLIEAFKASASQDAFETIKRIGNSGLDSNDPQVRDLSFKIFEIAVEQSPLRAARNLKSFHLDLKKPEVEQSLIKLFKTASQQDARGALDYITRSGLPFKVLKETGILREIICSLPPLKGTVLNQETSDELDSILKNVEEQKDPKIQTQILEDLAFGLQTLDKSLTENQIKWVMKQNILDRIFKIRTPQLWSKIIKNISEAIPNESELNSTSIKGNGQIKEAIWVISESLKKRGIENIDLITDRFFSDFKKEIKNSRNFKPILHFLILLENAPCKDYIKNNWLKTLANSSPDNFFQDLKNLTVLIELGENEIFQESIGERTSLKLQEKLQLDTDDHLVEKFQNSFGSSRNPQAIQTYAGKILSIGDENLSRPLRKFIQSVLNESFQEERYSLNDSPHLQAMQPWLPTWRESISSSIQEGITSIDTDNPHDLLFCGTEVGGSCLRVDGDSDLSRGLLGGLMNGQNRLIAVVDSDNRILARCFVRLLKSSGPEEAALFLEQPYGDPKYFPALLEQGKKKAKQVNLPLTSCENSFPMSKLCTIYPSTLQSLSGIAPDYSDAQHGVQQNPYTIDRILYRLDQTKKDENDSFII